MRSLRTFVLVLLPLATSLSLFEACRSPPPSGASPGASALSDTDVCLTNEGDTECTTYTLPDPDPPLDPGLDPLTANLSCSSPVCGANGGAAGGDAGGGAAGAGGGAAGGGTGDAEGDCDWYDLLVPDCAADPAACSDGSGGDGGGDGGAAGAGGGAGAGGVASGGATGSADLFGDSPHYSPQAGPVEQKTWQDVWNEWCDISKPAVQDWCKGEGAGPPQAVKNVIGANFSYACCQFSWTGNNWTRDPGHRQSNGNCTDTTKQWCENVPKPAWACDMSDAQWAALGVFVTFYDACMLQMAGWKGKVGNTHLSGAIIVGVCNQFARVGCKGLDAMIKKLAATPNPTISQKQLLEALLAVQIALCTNKN